MNLPDWLESDEDPVPANPELDEAIQRYLDHFGKFDLNTIDFYSPEEIIDTIDACIKMNKSFWEWHGRDKNVIAY